MEDMSEKELRTRRVTTRDTAARKRGEKIMEVEPVEVRSCNGGMATPCGSFVYLGSLTTAKCSSGPEIRRRILKAGVVYSKLWRIWAMKGLSLKLKGTLYSAFVHSEILYNCEVWVINKGEMEALEGKNVYLMRKAANKVVRDGEKRLSNQQLRQMLGLESIEEMIRKKETAMGCPQCKKRGS